MVSQGDVTLLQRITQPEEQSQLVSGSANLACGQRERGGAGLQPPAHCTGIGPPFRGKQSF